MTKETAHSSDGSDCQHLLEKEPDSEQKSVSKIEKLWPYLVLASCMLSVALGTGFNFGIAGALTVSQSQRFDISLDQASWSTSIHNLFFLMLRE